MTSCVVDKIIYFIIRETCRKTRTSLDLLYKIQTSLFVGGGGRMIQKKKNIFASQGFLCADQKPLSGEVKKNKTLLYSTNVNFLQIYGKYFLREKVGGELITQVFVYVMLHRRTNGFLTRFTTDFLNVTPFTEV